MIDRLPISILLLLPACCLAFYFTACDVDFVDARPKSIDAQASLTHFQQHVHPLFTELGCSGCHIPGGKASGHLFADPDINNAHKIALTKVNFGSLETSKLIERAKDGHHSNCDKASGECDDNAQKLIAALKKWHAGRGRAISNAIITDEKNINPDGSPTYSSKEVSFVLNEYLRDVEGFVTLKMKADKQPKADGGKTLTFSNFELSSTDDSIYLKGLLAMRNGEPSPDQTLSRVCTLVVPLSDDQTKTELISAQSTSFTIAANDSEPDNIAFEIKELRVAKESDKCEEDSDDKIDLDEAREDFNSADM